MTDRAVARHLRALQVMLGNARLLEGRFGEGRPVRLDLAAATAESFEAALSEAAERLEGSDRWPALAPPLALRGGRGA